jgi:hypothetical protein
MKQLFSQKTESPSVDRKSIGDFKPSALYSTITPGVYGSTQESDMNLSFSRRIGLTGALSGTREVRRSSLAVNVYCRRN